MRFVLLVGVMSFFADFTYEGSRSIIGPYLGQLGAGALELRDLGAEVGVKGVVGRARAEGHARIHAASGQRELGCFSRVLLRFAFRIALSSSPRLIVERPGMSSRLAMS